MRISDWSSDVCSSDLCMVAASRVGSAALRVVGAVVDLVACGGAIIGEESAGAAGAGGAGGGADCRCTGGDGVSIGEGSSKTTGGSCGAGVGAGNAFGACAIGRASGRERVCQYV